MLRDIIVDKLESISESIAIIQERSREYSCADDFMSSPWGMTVFDACVMRLQTIGETIKSIDEKTGGIFLPRYPFIPWRKIIGLRNIISHEYENIDAEVIWDIIENHLPHLSDAIDNLKSKLI